MAIELRWETKRLLCVKYSGTVSGDDMLASQESMANDERFDDIRKLILDGLSITRNLITDRDIEKFTAVAIGQSKSNPFIKNAVVLNASEDIFALAAYYQLLASSTGWEIELFKVESEARNWLGC